jgi:CheY-like chemotaxis protein
LYVELVVEDDGHGINPAEIDTIFEPFFSTKAPTEGSGLGLSMVQGFMKQSGGAAFVTSTPGSGARFSLLFQVSTSIDDQGSIQEFKRLPNTRRAPSGATLMVVDDEPEIVGSLKALLSTSGYTVRTASSGDAAWRSLSADANVDLVLSDVVMPGDLQGTDLACKIQQLKPNIPVILMSGHPLGKKENLRAPDIRYFLEKPVRKKTLINAIEDALDSRRNAVVDWRPD